MDGATEAWVGAAGLTAGFARVFDGDLPRDLPSSHMRLVEDCLRRYLPPPPPGGGVLAAVGAGVASAGVALPLDAAGVSTAVRLSAAAVHSPLAAVMTARYRGQPRVPFTKGQLAAGFEVFPPALPSALAPPPPLPSAMMAAAATPVAAAAAAAAAGGGSSMMVSGLAVAPGEVSAAAAAAAGGDDEVPLTAAEAALLPQLTLYQRQVEALNRTILAPEVARLRALRWKDWPFNDNNPFVVKITRTNHVSLGVPDYFKVIKRPMDLTRIRERAEAVISDRAIAESKPAACYGSVDEFLADVALVVYNAKLFNLPASARGTWEGTQTFMHPRVLPAAELRGNVYSMAFDLEGVVAAAEPALRAAWARAELAAKRVVMEDARRAMSSHAPPP